MWKNKKGKNQYIKCSLIVSTYNWPEALELCLQSVLKQIRLPDEVIIADDGSKEATKKLISKFQQTFPVPLHHVWQQDDGFQLAKIRNKSIARSRFEYIIQIDGDVLLHPYFIADHLSFAKDNTLVRASRIYINAAISKKMLVNKTYKITAFSKGITNFFSALRIPVLRPFFEKNYKIKGLERFEIHGCNMAFWRNNAIAVNGYNEQFKGWGPEDKEFVTRMLNKGIEKRFIKMGAIVFHIYHKERSREFLEAAEQMLTLAISQKKVFCDVGIHQYL